MCFFVLFFKFWSLLLPSCGKVSALVGSHRRKLLFPRSREPAPQNRPMQGIRYAPILPDPLCKGVYVQYIGNTTRKRPREWMVFAYIIYNMHCTHLLLSIALCQWVKGHYDIMIITIVKLVITVLNISISPPRAEIVTNPFLLS